MVATLQLEADRYNHQTSDPRFTNEVIGLAQTNCQQNMSGSCLSRYVHEGLSTLPLLAFSRLATSAGGRPPSQPDPYKANTANIKLLFVTLCVKRAFTRLA